MIGRAALSARTVGAFAMAVVLLPQPAAAAGCGDGAPATSRSLSAPAASELQAVPDAMTIARLMDRNLHVFMAQPRDEGPRTVIIGGFCTIQLAGTGCHRMVSTKDASVIVFGTAGQADDYDGCGDDDSDTFGRTVLSFGSPERVAEVRQPAYVRAVRTFRRNHPEARNDADRIVRYLARRGLPMRDPQIEDERRERLGRASEIPGAVSMAATGTADVIVFSTRASARRYMGNSDDTAYRYGRVVLSYGNPARVIPSQRDTYERVLRNVLS